MPKQNVFHLSANSIKLHVNKIVRFSFCHYCLCLRLVISSPQGIIDDKNEVFDSSLDSLRRTEDHALNLKCIIAPENAAEEKQVEWEYSADNTQYAPISSDIQKLGAEMHIDSVQKSHRGYYRCKLNGITFTILLRVKGKERKTQTLHWLQSLRFSDKLAALWPFLGIIGTVLVLVIIILIFEKRQKTNKKSNSNDEDDHDRASDP